MNDLLQIDLIAEGGHRKRVLLELNLNVEIHEDMSILGGKIWQGAATVLCDYIKYRVDEDSSAFKDATVLELGCGTGVVGLSCLRTVGGFGGDRGLKELILTDLPFLCPLISENCLLNGYKDAMSAGHLKVESLPWGVLEVAPIIEPIDIVLISDCVYIEECFDLLLQTLKCLITPRTVCYMSYEKRRRAEKRFFVALNRAFKVRSVRWHEC